MSWKSVIQELGCYVMSSKPIGVSVSDMRHSGHVPPLSESGHGAPAALSHPCPKWSASQARAYWGDLACVMNVIFSEPTRRLLARAVCHNPQPIKANHETRTMLEERNRLRVTLRSQARDAEDVKWGWLAETGDRQGVLLMRYEYEKKK